MDRDEIITQVADLIKALTKFHQRMVAGEKLCDYHYNWSDRCFETYCTGCGCHIGGRHEIFDVPFKSEAYCYTCYTRRENK